MKPEPGTYVLVLRSDERKRIQIGKWGPLQINPGFYLYVGSAVGPGGVQARVSRHCRQEKARRWHIDFLREHTEVNSVWYAHGPGHLEHEWAKALEGAKGTVSVKGFGCSDCRCKSHLFFVAHATGLPECAAALKGNVEQRNFEREGVEHS